MESKLEIAHYEHCGISATVYLVRFEHNDYSNLHIEVETLDKVFKLDINGFGGIDDFLKGLNETIQVHDLAGGYQDILDYMDRFCVSWGDIPGEEFYCIE